VLQVAALPEVAPEEKSHKDTGQKSDDYKVMQKDTAGAAEPVEPAVESRKQPRQPGSQVKVGMVGLESVNDGRDQPEAVAAEKAPRSTPTEADRKMTSQTATTAAAKRPEPTRITVGKSRRSNTRGKLGQVDLQAETTTSAAALYRKAVSYQKQMKWNAAIETYKQVIRLEPMSAEVYNNLGVCYEKQGDLKMAAMSYEKAITINPRFYPSYNNLGIIYYRLKNFEKARYAYEQALELNPGNSQSEVNLALVYERLNRDTLARRTLERVLVNDPSNAAAHYNLGRMLEDQGDPEAALTHYRQFLASSPSAYPQVTEKVKDRVRSLQEISNK
jgi:Tfp pilus assembly protein PilF